MNVIFQYLKNEERSLKWFCEKHNLSYKRFYTMKPLTNEELAEKLTFQEVEELQKVIKNLKQELRK